MFDLGSLEPQDRSLHCHTAMSFCSEELFQKISSIIMTHESNDILDSEALDMLASASVIAVNILKHSDDRCLMWPKLLHCVIGDKFWSAGQARCVGLQALYVILETIERTSAASEPLVSAWSCSALDAIVIRCLDILCFLADGEHAPGILEAARLASVTKLALPLQPSVPPSLSGRSGGGVGPQRLSLLSEQALLQLTDHVVAFLRAAAQRRPARVDGRAMAVNEAAGAAALDVAEGLIRTSLPSAAKTRMAASADGSGVVGQVVPQGGVGELVDAVFALVGHSDQARLTIEYHHGPAEGARLRSRLGCRATEVWAAWGRDVQVRLSVVIGLRLGSHVRVALRTGRAVRFPRARRAGATRGCDWLRGGRHGAGGKGGLRRWQGAGDAVRTRCVERTRG